MSNPVRSTSQSTLPTGLVLIASAHLATSVALLAAAAPAAKSAPAPASGAVQPEKPAVDKSTPKGALLDIYVACIAGDRVKLQSLVHAAAPSEQKGADTVVDLLLSEARWLQALNSRFPGDAFAQGGGGTSLFPRNLETIAAAVETTSADKASVLLSPGGVPVPMIKTAAGWKIAAADVLDPTAKGGSLDAAIAAASAKAQAYASTSGEVAVGTYASAQLAYQALQKKLGIVPATPSTRP
jgi:hypothetical protein